MAFGAGHGSGERGRLGRRVFGCGRGGDGFGGLGEGDGFGGLGEGDGGALRGGDGWDALRGGVGWGRIVGSVAIVGGGLGGVDNTARLQGQGGAVLEQVAACAGRAARGHG